MGKGKKRIHELSTTHYTETKRLGNTNRNTYRGECSIPERASSLCSTSGNRRVTLIINPLISHERGKGRIGVTTNGTYLWSIVSIALHHFTKRGRGMLGPIRLIYPH
jgi:hypothetical protein